MSFGSNYGENVFWLCHLTSADLARTYQWNLGQWCEEGHLQNIKCSSRFFYLVLSVTYALKKSDGILM